MKTGAMLGYVYDGDTKRACAGVSNYIKRKVSELMLMSPKKINRAAIKPDRPIYETRHRLGKRSFKIYHIFLAV
jgi:hypothetical protein